VREASGGRIHKMTINSNPDGAVKCECECYFQSLDKEGTKQSVSVLTTDPYHFSDVQSGITLNSITYATIENFQLVITRHLEELYTHQNVSAADPFEILSNKLEYELTATIAVSNTNIWDLLHDRTDFTTVVKFQRSASDYVQFTFSNCKIQKVPHPMTYSKAVRGEARILFKSISVEVKDDIPYYSMG